MVLKRVNGTIIYILCAAVIFGATAASGAVSVKSSAPGSIVVEYRPVREPTDTVMAANNTYQRLNYEGHLTTEHEPGAPALPGKKVFFAVPKGVVPSLSIANLSASTSTGVTIPPVPRFEQDGSGFSVEVYEENPEYYALSGLRPKSHVELGEKQSMNGIDVWEIIIHPVRFDAVASTVTATTGFDLEISFAGGAVSPEALPKRLPDYIINRDQYEIPITRKTTAQSLEPFTSGDWYKITIDKSGFYGISGNDLAKTGFPVGSVEIDKLRMYYGDGLLIDQEMFTFSDDQFREIAIEIEDVSGNGVFNSNDVIVFYGESVHRFYSPNDDKNLTFQNHLYADNNVYWLTISDEGLPSRVGETGVAPDGGSSAVTTYRYTKHLENDYHVELIQGGKEWFWEAISSNTTKQVPFSAQGFVSGDTTIFRFGFLNQYHFRRHNLYVYVNDEKPANYPFSAQKGFFIHKNTDDLKAEGNIINIVRQYMPGEADVNVRLDWIEIEYERSLAYTGNNFDFFRLGDGSPVTFSVSNVTKSSIRAYNTTDPFNVGYMGSAQYNAASRTLTFRTTPPAGKQFHFTLSDKSSRLKAASIEKKQRTNLRNLANNPNYILITNSLFLDEAKKLAKWRAQDSSVEPLRPIIVDVNDIFDEFNWGVYDPLAIRNYLRYIWDNGNPDDRYYCCILGDTTYKYKNLSEDQIGKNYVPTYTAYESYLSMTTDDYFCWFTRNHYPAFSVGRLCAIDKETAQILVDKIIDYEKDPEQGLWHNRVLFVSDDELRENGIGQEIVHSVDTESLDSLRIVPPSFERLKIMMVEYPLKNLRKPDVTEALLNTINDGCVITNYIGHGNDDLLAHEHILVGTRDLERFNNGGRQTLFLAFSCTVGNYVQLNNISLAEMLHLRKGGGAVGVIAATHETHSSDNTKLNKAFFLNIFNREKNPEHRIGYALSQAKTDYPGTNSNRYMLFGDPASRLMIPRYNFAIAPIDTIYRLQKLDLSGSITSGGESVPYNGTMYIKANGPKIHKTYSTEGNLRSFTYTQPGKTFYFGEKAIQGNAFDAALVVPKDLPSNGSESYIYFYAQGQDVEASGVICDFAIGGFDKNAPDDRTGPEIQIAFDAKSFDDGDYISRQPNMKVTFIDPSSINIYGNRGHNITLIIDKKEIVVLTERFKTVNSHTTGMIEYTLPILTPGEHILELNAYDTYNNAAKKSVTANVVGTASGDIAIMNLLNYPNPMGKDGTMFTFSLTDDARQADIKVYSQSGRLVDKMKFSANYGFNQVSWKPPFTLANGVYFYKLSVRSINGRKSSKIEKLVVMK